MRPDLKKRAKTNNANAIIVCQIKGITNARDKAIPTHQKRTGRKRGAGLSF